MYKNNLDFVAHVTGVLNRNVDIRNEHLKRNIGKYSQWDKPLVPAIGEVYDIDFQRPLYDITNGESLLDYTHNDNGIYSNMINSIYFSKEREKETIGFDTQSPDSIQAWANKFIDYPKYMDEIFGEDIYSRHVRYINDLLSGQYIENALRQTNVNVIKPMVSIAKQGIITTNNQNMSGKDTTLGTISNYMYSTLLYNGAIFNSDRKSNEKYITPSLFNQYGNNLSNVMELGDILTIGTNEPRLTDNLGADAKIIHNYEQKFDERTINLKYLTQTVEEASKYVSEINKGYLGFIKYGNDGYIKVTEDKYNNPIIDVIDILGNSNFNSEYKPNLTKTYDIYSELDNKNNNNENQVSSNEDIVSWEHYESIDSSISPKSLLSKTNKLFNEHKINSLVGRFHTSVDGGISNNSEFTDTAKSKFGNSHGRNLLTKNAEENGIGENINGYDNPYCRTWTHHHQYNQVKKLIRPFKGDNDKNGEETTLKISDIQSILKKYRSKDTGLGTKEKPINGGEYLANNTVLGNNGFVNICPSNDIIDKKTTQIKNCMFSIENLAWKDVDRSTENYISKEQTGPNKGRIMWFPPYDLSFNENVNVEWNQNTFIGRGEKVYTYTNTDRIGSLTFTMLIDHPSIVNSFSKLDDSASYDIDSDILRYFAGCEIPELPIEKDEEKEPPIKTPPEIIVEPQSEIIKFYVFFPNNYSGSISISRTTGFDNNDNKWWKYVLFGNNATIFNDSSKWIGYETSDKPICDYENIDEVKDSWMPVCNDWMDYYKSKKNDAYLPIGKKCEKGDWSEANKQEDGKYCWKYQPDPDMRQRLYTIDSKGNYQDLLRNGSYKDEKSFQLNTKVYEDCNYSFADFICALLELDFLSWADNEDEPDLTQEAIAFLKEKGANIERVNKLKAIFSATNIEYVHSKAQGSADGNDINNSYMLARRREQSLKEIIDKTILLNFDTKTETMEPERIEKGRGNASTEKNKKNRCAYAEIEYKMKDKITKVSDGKTIPAKTNEETESGITETAQFNEWYEELVSKTSIVKEYENIFNNEDYEKTYEKYQNDLKDFCKSFNISINKEDYTSDEDWNKAVDMIIENYRYEYLMPADTISYTEGAFNTDFFEWIKKYQPKNASTDTEEEIKRIDSEISGITEEIEENIEEYNKISEKNTELHLKISELNDNIEELKEKNNRKNDEIISCQTKIDELQYQLDHWTTSSKEKSELKSEIKEKQNEIDSLEREIKENNEKIARYESDIEDANESIESNKQKLNVIEKNINDDTDKRTKLNSKRENLVGQNYLNLDLVRTELYFEKMDEYSCYNQNDYNDWDDNNEQIVSYPKNIKITKNWKNYPYTKYNGSNLSDKTENEIYSSSLLLQDYLVIDFTSKIDKGVEFAYDKLYENKDDNNRLKELLYLGYLLNGRDNSDWIYSQNEEDIKFADSWKFITDYYINNSKSKKVLNYRPFLSAIKDVNEKLIAYNNAPEGKEKEDAKKELLKSARQHTTEILKLVETETEELLNILSSEAQTQYNAEKQDYDAKAQEKALLEAKNKKAEEEKKKKDAEIAKRNELYLKAFVKSNSTRYETEAEYFSKLKITDPLIFKSIKEKFKYFNPAFHSMSPEGFNARLNFLHQCTRQGQTVENNGTACNLAFGRMPVCVLKIGDFINTKIIIQTVSINYDNGGIQWDLNPEGIGVQPMFAKITLGIILLGGQSLQGPINRLQNALSFDYYANTGVYDDRADFVDYDDNGEITYKKIFNAMPPKPDEEQTKTNTDDKKDSIDKIKEGQKLSEQDKIRIAYDVGK